MRLLLVLVVLAGCAFALEKEMQREAKEFLATEDKVKDVAKNAVRGKERAAENNGEAAIRRIRKRWAELQRRPAECRAKPTVAMRDDCMTEYRRDRRRTRQELKVVKKMEKCVRRFKKATQADKRKNCVKRAAIEFLKLRPIRAVIKEDQKVVVKDAKKVVKAAKKGDRAETKKRVEAAIKALYKRLADIHTRKNKCRDLESEQHFKECMVPVKALIAKNMKERNLVKALGACRKIKDASKRERCTIRAEDNLLSVADPGTPAEVPASVRDLDREVVKTVDSYIGEVEKERAKLRECESSRCRRVIKRKIARIQSRVKGVKSRFNPRRKCLKARAAARAKEFRARAREHAELTEIHDAAMDCYDTKCTAEEEVQQARLEKAIMERRKKFTAEWKKLRCPFVAPEHDEPATKKKMAPHQTHNLNSLAAMRQRLVELYANLDECDTGACKAKTRKDIKDLTELIELLTGVEQRTLTKKRVDHSNRAALHRKLTKYYLLAADCRSRQCRVQYRERLRTLTKSLDKMDRDELGRVKESVKNQNKYFSMLRKALTKCPKSALGHGCRQMVVHAFRAGTELREKALMEYLADTARSNAQVAVHKCNANKATAPKCIAAARAKLAKRLAQLKIREMRVEKRRAERLCKLTKDASKCNSDVEAEYKRDKKVAAKQADKEASKTVTKADKDVKEAVNDAKALKQAQGKMAAPRAASAATVGVSVLVALLCVALAL